MVHLPASFSSALPLSVLDLSNSRIPELSLSHFSMFPNLNKLNMSGCSTQRITGVVSQSLGELRVLDMRGCPVTEFSPGVFRKLNKLQALYSSTYRLCCSDLLPGGFNLHNCFAPSDSLSDCDSLLKDDIHVIFTAIATVLAVIGNVAGCVARLVRSTACDVAFRALMLHLCMSDGVMGIYLAIVSVAAWNFQGHYLWQDFTWRRSEACHLSAFPVCPVQQGVSWHRQSDHVGQCWGSLCLDHKGSVPATVNLHVVCSGLAGWCGCCYDDHPFSHVTEARGAVTMLCAHRYLYLSTQSLVLSSVVPSSSVVCCTCLLVQVKYLSSSHVCTGETLWTLP